jgi:hypothetical protein
LEAFIVPPVAVQLRLLFSPPEADPAKLVVVPTVTVGAAGTIAATTIGVIVTTTEAAVVSPAGFATVRVKVLFEARAPDV